VPASASHMQFCIWGRCPGMFYLPCTLWSIPAGMGIVIFHHFPASDVAPQTKPQVDDGPSFHCQMVGRVWSIHQELYDTRGQQLLHRTGMTRGWWVATLGVCPKVEFVPRGAGIAVMPGVSRYQPGEQGRKGKTHLHFFPKVASSESHVLPK